MAEANRVAIRVRGLRYSYPNGLTEHAALDGVDLTVTEGEKVALLGPNGAGKTTLLLHLNGLLTGSGGVEVFGRRVIDADKAELARIRARVGLIFQDPDDQLFSNTVAEDVAFGPIHMGLDSNEVQARVESAMADVGLSGFEDRAPYHLSGGEKRRSAIATVLSMRPEIIVADEPSSGLDPRARRELIRLIESLPQTMLVATHDVDLAREVLPRCVIMNNGRVVADGPTAELTGDRGFWSRVDFNGGWGLPNNDCYRFWAISQRHAMVPLVGA